MNLFNFYDIWELVEEMSYGGGRHDSGGVLDRSTGHCICLEDMDSLPILIEKKVDLQDAIFLPTNGDFWDEPTADPSTKKDFAEKYLPSLAPLIQKLNEQDSKKEWEVVDEVFCEFVKQDEVLSQICEDYLFDKVVRLYYWCRNNGVELMDQQKAWEENLTRQKPRINQYELRDAVGKMLRRHSSGERFIVVVDRQTLKCRCLDFSRMDSITEEEIFCFPEAEEFLEKAEGITNFALFFAEREFHELAELLVDNELNHHKPDKRFVSGFREAVEGREEWSKYPEMLNPSRLGYMLTWCAGKFIYSLPSYVACKHYRNALESLKV